MEEIEAMHDLHIWSLSSEFHALSAHVVLNGHPTLEEAQVVGSKVKKLLSDKFSVSHATLDLECEPCVDDIGTFSVSDK